MLYPGVFEVSEYTAMSSQPEKMSVAGMEMQKFRGQAAAKDLVVCTWPGPGALSRRPRGRGKRWLTPAHLQRPCIIASRNPAHHWDT